MKIHKKLDHGRVVKFHSSGQNGKLVNADGKIFENLIYIIMDYVPEGTLVDVVENFQGVGELIAHYFMQQMIEGLEYLHKQNVSHLDIKMENILVDAGMNLQIIDFGFSSMTH